jgi:aspartyl/asparaginyl beta-hydroxylase (cupin superfamily)
MSITADTSERFANYLTSIESCLDFGALGHYEGLTPQPFHDAAAFPIVADLENAYDAIKAEIAALDGDQFHREVERVARSGRWSVCMLFERGRKHEDHCRSCPTLTSIIERHRTVRTIAGITYVSRMSPFTHIAPHTGPTNLRLRCHLGIQVPAGDCALRVGGIVRQWKEGRCLVFDDALEHEAWNHTSQDRTVVIIDLWHPDLTDREVHLLQGLHHYAAVQAEPLARYWAANQRARQQLRTQID